MLGRFGSREICDVTFKSLVEQTFGNHTFKAGQPVFVIDTATASSMEQATTSNYANGGRGYARLIAWEGEKTMTFNVTDALMSPLGLAMLTGAGFSDASDTEAKHVHVTYDVAVNASGAATIPMAKIKNELQLKADAEFDLCPDTDNIKPYATILDSFGGIVGWVDAVTLTKSGTDITVAATLPSGTGACTIKLDFYIVMHSGVTQVTIKPEDFGGFFYVEADTLYRNEAGKDMAATLTFPKVKIQSGFTLSMSPTGDPSTFDFVMDAFPAYTYFDNENKVICDITIVSGDTSIASGVSHTADTVKHAKTTSQPGA